jgi:hypothetical protein
MEYTTHTPQAENIEGREMADALFDEKLQTAKTIGEVRTELDELMTTVQQPNQKQTETGARLEELKAAVDQVSDGGAHDSIKLQDDLGAGVLGQNMVGTRESEIRRDQIDPEHVTANTRHVMDTVLHEDSEDLGHAGQDAKARVNIIKDGKPVDSVVLFEGNVVTNVSNHLGEQREGLPEEVYQEGAKLVGELGAEEVDAYLRKGGAKQGEHLQELVWEKQGDVTLDQMVEEGQAVGMSDSEIVKAAEKQGKFDQSRAPRVLAA